ncbi:hypothetical protein [Nonlabens agnitus]|uniref:hypothetical protein n=1 Tax=Nonlabens agnitus TaxID=870484 RepID=UPI0011B26492|nr:hypothetical protein [Nonlabens agnitus]
MAYRLQNVLTLKIFALLFLFSQIAVAQSCVCYQKDLLNDFKDTDFIGVVNVLGKKSYPSDADIDVISISTQEIIKGSELSEFYIFQKKGNGKNNDQCKLYLKEGDQLLLYANQKGEYHYTMPCYRNKKLGNSEVNYQVYLQNHLKILRQLKRYQNELAEVTTRCSDAITDIQIGNTVGNIPLKTKHSRVGLYSVKFTEDDKIDRIEVVSTFNEEVDNKVRIALIKKKWKPCKLNDDRKLILGYFYTPATKYRQAHLSPL